MVTSLQTGLPAVKERVWLAEAKRVLREEAEAISAANDRIDEAALAKAIGLILDCQGRVVATGMGKCGPIGKKFAGTLSSTGTPALFLHPAEGVHGDLGMLAEDDVLIAFSNSGETDEIRAILPAVQALGVPIIAFTGRPQSTLGRSAAAVLDVHVDKEACYLNLAPTTSTTLMLAFSDALAVAVMGARGFTASEYAARHPSGSLGRRLLLRVRDVMRTGDAAAIVPEDASLREAVVAITRAHVGAAIIVDAVGKVSGIVAESDLRRHLLDSLDYWTKPVRDSMNPRPGLVPPNILAVEGLQLLESFHPEPGHRAGEAPVVDENDHPIGLLVLKDLVKAGIV